jgi:hypothetical protein
MAGVKAFSHHATLQVNDQYHGPRAYCHCVAFLYEGPHARNVSRLSDLADACSPGFAVTSMEWFLRHA